MDPKIIATVGPTSEDYQTLKKLVKAGVNIIRVNFSHASPEQWKNAKANLAQIKKETGIDVKMMMDLQGPRIRVGQVGEGVNVVKGKTYTIFYGTTAKAENEIPVDYKGLVKDVKKGDVIYFANRLVEMEVEKIMGDKIYAVAKNSGLILKRKGLNLPDTNLMLDVLGPKDIKDAKFGMAHGADYMCLSFVKEGSEIARLRKLIKGKSQIIAKIESKMALRNIDGIIKESDGIMIARGDLGIEVPIEEIAIIQKNLVRHAHQYRKPAIVATEMLASMTAKPYPTRAEATDVANAVFDGADAVMLSDETASGKFPVESVQMMKTIVAKVDEYFNATNLLK